MLCTSATDGARWVRDSSPARPPRLVPVGKAALLRGSRLDDLWWTAGAARHESFETALTTLLPCFSSAMAVPPTTHAARLLVAQMRHLTEKVAEDAAKAGDQR